MFAKEVANFFGTYLLPFNNSRVVCPPGKIFPGTGQLIVVPTVMRSGTHLLIDAILNNFPKYKRKPLYIDLDRLLDNINTRSINADKLLYGGNYIVKTHYPQNNYNDGREEILSRIFDKSKIITINRNIDSALKSAFAWGLLNKENESTYRKRIAEFHKYWENYDILSLQFEDIISRGNFPESIKRIEAHISCKAQTPISFPASKNSPFSIYSAKILTRILGRFTPVVNTTINFNRSNS